MSNPTPTGQDEARRALRDQVPQITHQFACGLAEYDCTVHAENLSFEEALEITHLIGKFVSERRKIIKALPVPAALNEGGGK